MQNCENLNMAAVVESAMRELHVYGTTAADNAEAPSQAAEPVKAVAEPGTPIAAEKSSAESTAEKAKKQRRRRGKKPAAAADKVTDENAAPAEGTQTAAPAADGKPSAAPVDVAAILKARAAAKKGGRKQSDAQKAALANAKARPATKKKAPKGRVVADPGCNGY